MRLEPADEATEFAREVRLLLEKRVDRPALRAAWDAGEPIADLARELAAMGALGLAIDEERGGAGLDLTAALPLIVELGRSAAPGALVTSIAAAEILSRSSRDDLDELLSGIAEGTTTVGLGLGPGKVALGAGWVDLLLLRDGDDVHLVPAGGDGLGIRDLVNADRGRRLATLAWQPAGATRLARVTAEAAFDIAVVTAAAELVGVAEAMLDMSVDYAKTREQFGQPIGGFQAVKHHLANVFVELSFAKPLVAKGFWSVAIERPTMSRDASHAFYAAATAAQTAARIALQVHAGIGYTYEHDLHMWLKRTWTLTSVFGDPAWHRERVAQHILDGD